jgi:hypothetical protein
MGWVMDKLVSFADFIMVDVDWPSKWSLLAVKLCRRLFSAGEKNSFFLERMYIFGHAAVYVIMGLTGC